MLKQDTTTKEFTEAFQSLQRLNNDLFYNDLKTRMQEMVERYEASYDQSTDALTKLDSNVNRIVFTIEDEINNLSREFLSNSSEAVDLTTKKVEAVFQQHGDVLNGMIAYLEKALVNFKKLQLLFKSQHETHQKQLEEQIELQKERFEAEKAERLQLQQQHYDAVRSLLTDHEKILHDRLQILESLILEKLDRTEKAQQELGLAIQEAAIAQAHSQQEMLESQFTILAEKMQDLQKLNENKHRSTFKWLVGLLVGESVVIAIQLISYFV